MYFNEKAQSTTCYEKMRKFSNIKHFKISTGRTLQNGEIPKFQAAECDPMGKAEQANGLPNLYSKHTEDI